MRFLNKMNYCFFSSTGSLCDPGFSQILAFRFYDGPEIGVAVFPAGEALRFSVVGESRSRMFRAFECTLLEGNWRAKVLEAYGEAAHLCTQVGWNEGGNQNTSTFEKDVLGANALGHYIAVGRPYLDMLSAVEVTSDELEQLQSTVGDDAFYIIHSKIKNHRKKLQPPGGMKERKNT
jgi:hypothetical protein